MWITGWPSGVCELIKLKSSTTRQLCGKRKNAHYLALKLMAIRELTPVSSFLVLATRAAVSSRDTAGLHTHTVLNEHTHGNIEISQIHIQPPMRMRQASCGKKYTCLSVCDRFAAEISLNAHFPAKVKEFTRAYGA